MKFCFYITLLLIIVTSCTNNAKYEDAVVLKLKPSSEERNNQLYYDNLDTVFLVQCQTSENAIIGSVCGLEFTKDRIIILDLINVKEQVSVFDRQGKFIYSIPSGNSAKELLPATSLGYDPYKEQIIVHQLGNQLSFYSVDGEYIDRVSDMSIWAQEVLATQNGYLIKIPESRKKIPAEPSNCLLLEVDKKYNLKRDWIPRREGLRHAPVSHTGYLHYGDNCIMVTSSYNDTIYEYTEENGLRKKYILEYPDRLEEKNYREDLASDFRLKVKHNIFDGDYLDNGTHEYIQLWADWGTTQYFINKRNGKMLQTCDKLSNGIHRDFSLLRPCFKTNDGYFVNEVSPGRAYEYTTLMKHLSDKDKEILNNSTKEDNPIFVFFKLKDF